jgi:hypothetical protein
MQETFEADIKELGNQNTQLNLSGSKCIRPISKLPTSGPERPQPDFDSPRPQLIWTSIARAPELNHPSVNCLHFFTAKDLCCLACCIHSSGTLLSTGHAVSTPRLSRLIRHVRQPRNEFVDARLTYLLRAVFSLIIINKAGGLVYQREFQAGLRKLSTNDYLVLAGTFHG